MYDSAGEFAKKVAPIAFDRLIVYRNGQALPPHTLETQPTMLCPLRCRHCSYWKRNQEKATLPYETILSLCDSMGKLGVKFCPISGGGEPTADPHIEQLIQHARIAVPKVALITNGVLWENIEGVADLLTYIQVSLPAVQPKTYKNITGANERILSKVLSMPFELRKRLGKFTPNIGAKVIVTDQNAGEAIEILKVAKAKGFDYCFYRVVADFEERGLALSEKSKKVLENSILENIDLCDADYTNLADLFNESKFLLKRNDKRCWSLDLRLLSNVDAFGDVYLCVPDIGDRDYAIGNIKEQSLENIWNSERHRSIIEKLQKRYAEGKCQNCRCLRYNAVIEQINEFLPSVVDDDRI